MKRQLMPQLASWKSAPDRKPLLLVGARQVGKTTLLQKFGEEYFENTVLLDFDDRPDLKQLFEPNLEPKRIIKSICLALDVDIQPRKTLLIFDEIQECPNALNSLKYFKEKANQYPICGAGSLLGVKLAHTKGFPVGKVHFKTLYPLNYCEFLEALNQDRLKDYLSSFQLNEQIPEPIHQKLIEFLKIYFITGGMPEAIATYKKTEDFNATRTVHQDILNAYQLDFSKHAPPALIMKISECFRSITAQLAKENKKFIYSVVRQGARARDYEDAIQWLVEAGLFNKVYNTNTPKLPLNAYENRNLFKIYLLDVGLLNTLANLPIKTILQGNDLFQEFRGSLTENFAAQALARENQVLYYWTSNGRAEVDFIFQRDEFIYPLEVKSGFSRHKKSLILYQEKYKPKFILRASPQNFTKHNGFINCPLYMIDHLHRLLEAKES